MKEQSYTSILQIITTFGAHSEALRPRARCRAEAAEAQLSGGNLRRFEADVPDLGEQNEWYHWIQRGRNHGNPFKRL